MGNSEAANYVSEFQAVLNSARWEVESGFSALTGSGVIILTSRADDPNATNLQTALIKNGVEAAGQLGKNGPAKNITILFIGDKPF